MDSIKYDLHFFWITLISILCHLALCMVATLWFQFKGIHFSLPEDQSDKTIEVSQVDQSFLNKLRTVGIKGGKKEFQAPMNQSPSIALPSPSPRINLSPSALSMKLNQEELKAIGQRAKQPSLNAEGFNYKRSPKHLEQAREQQQNERALNTMIKREMLQQSIASHEQNLVRTTDINMHFEPPEGVEETELNSTEKKFYSFRKRSYEAYVNSFLSAYRQAVNQRPYLHHVFNTSTEHLTGKVTFDLEGNLISIKIISSAKNDDIQKVFEKTLEGIKSLKNPPREFIEKENEFSVYYSLRINNQ